MNMSLRLPRPSVIFAFVAAAVVAFVVPAARAPDLEPLRSADLDARLAVAGFDDAQRAKILADYAAYVPRFSAVVAERIVEWQKIAGAKASSLEEARTFQNKGRAAAQAIDDAERPLLDVIRTAARPDQAAAVQRLLVLLEIRRDLAFSSMLNEESFRVRRADLIEAVEGAGIAPEKLAALKPQLDQYLVERQNVVRRLRDATLNMPLRRVEAQQKYPLPPQPKPDSAASDPKQFQADIQAWFQTRQVAHEASMSAALVEKSAARLKATELDIRTLDAILPALGGRDQAHLLSRWCSNAGAMAFSTGSGPVALNAAWATPPNRISAEVAVQLDAICLAWISEWWPSAKESAIAAAQKTGFVLFNMGDAADAAKTERIASAIASATVRATEAIEIALDPDGAAAGNPSARAAAKEGQSNQANQIVFSSATVAVVGEGSELPITLDVVGLEGGMIVVDGEGVITFDGDGMGDGMTFEITGGPEGFKRPNPLPKLIRFEDIKPVLAAAGVDESMMAVSETAIDDLLAEAREITQAAEATQDGNSPMPGGMIEQGPDGLFKPVDPAVRAKRFAEREVLRARLLALEITKLNDLLPSVVPEAGRPVVSWLTAWRRLESERAAAGGNRNSFSNWPQKDLVQAVLSAQLTPADWKAVGPDLTVVCLDLAAQIHAFVMATAKAQAVEPQPQFAQQVNGEAPQVHVAVESTEVFFKLVKEADRLGIAAQAAASEAIPRLKLRLSAEAAQRLQDAWDDQLYARDLKDATNLSERFEASTTMVLTDPVRKKMLALQTSWRAAARAIRDRIVAIQSKPTKYAELPTIKFERDELNRRFFRELSAVLGAELASKLAPLSQGEKSRRGGGGMSGAAGMSLVAPPAPKP